MARKPKKEEHVNHERWLVSYADFVTLLFAFFTSLYAMGQTDAKKATALIKSTRDAFSLDIFPGEKPPTSLLEDPVAMQLQASTQRARERALDEAQKSRRLPRHNAEHGMNVNQFRALFQSLNNIITKKSLSGMQVTNNKYGLVISLKDAVFFDPARAELKRSSLPALDSIAEKVLGSHFDIRVEGHTDGSMVKGSRFKSNWELSTARAASVVNYFIEQFGYPPEQLAVAGYASTKPLTTNDTAAGRAANRRVDIVVLMPSKSWLPSPSEVNNPTPEPDDADKPVELNGAGVPASHDTGVVNPTIR